MTNASQLRQRDAQIDDFLSRTDWATARRSPLAGDASNRRYLRISGGPCAAVLMDAPPDRGEDTRPFVAITQWLLEHDFSAPRIFVADETNGFLLIEDLGDALYAKHLESSPEDETRLYSAAVDLLAKLSRIPVPSSVGSSGMSLPPYDMAVLEREAALLSEWWVPAVTGHATPDECDTQFRERVHRCFFPVSESRDVVVLRDYHAENLLWLPGRDGNAKVGLLDYQDALAGHPAYDLVSLLEDARRDTSPELQANMLDYYLEVRPELDQEIFRRDYALLGAQRNLKIVGIFARLWLRDGKPGYLDLIPRVWAHLMHDLTHPALAELQTWVIDHVPAPEPELLSRIRAGTST